MGGPVRRSLLMLEPEECLEVLDKETRRESVNIIKLVQDN
jgi:hypothetical protein